jgi:ubiquinone/menaquinone biosynthesis C-methylase UbiE
LVSLPLYFSNQITWHFLKKYVPKRRSCRILEAGAGTGDWAREFAKLGYTNIVLADISRGMLNEARKRLARLKKEINIGFVKSNIANMRQFKNNTFDYVFSQYDAVSYSLKPKKAMKELARVAKKGAYVVVSLDTKYSQIPRLIEKGELKKARELLKTSISHEFGHPQYNLTWEELGEYFNQAGLEVVEVIGAPVFTQRSKNLSVR